MAYRFKTFEEADIDGLYHAFVKAFAANSVTFSPSAAQFERRMFDKLHIAPSISSLILDDSTIVGFILHTVGNYENKITAYNGGTGLIPDHRGSKRSYLMYERLIPSIQATGAQRILLEVNTTNEAALRLYKTLGFNTRKTLKCFKLHDQFEDESPDVNVVAVDVFDPVYETFWAYNPTFLDSIAQLAHNLKNEIILEAKINKLSAGYIIFQPNLGRISQFAVAPQWRNQGIGRALLFGAQTRCYQKKLTIMNIPENQKETIEVLLALGFQNEVDQFEMELII
jgi:ribosomal protein S18 acetylase RimI-like enzyme